MQAGTEEEGGSKSQEILYRRGSGSLGSQIFAQLCNLEERTTFQDYLFRVGALSFEFTCPDQNVILREI